jgi:hypothetical protein
MYRNGVRLLFTLCVGASALSLAPAARAGDLSQFAGLLTGQLTGVFTADVFHAPNPSIVGTSAAVTGGTISVSNLFASTALTGSITSGSVTLAAEDPGCGRQRFRVGMQIAGLRGTAKGSVVTGGVGAASIWLTHYRTLVLTASGFRCATLVGTITGIPPDSGVSFTLTTSP